MLANAIEQSSGVTFTLDYMPWRAAVGASLSIYEDPRQSVALAGTMLYAGWSAYHDRHGDKPTPAFPWGDTISPTVGVRYRLEDLTTSFDLTYHPTPVPEQTGRTNYVDNDRVGASVGGEYSMRVFHTDVKLGVQVQAHHLISRYQRKLPTPTRANGELLAPELVRDELPDDAALGGEPIPDAEGLQTNNPGWPGFSSGGWILGGNVYLTVGF